MNITIELTRDAIAGYVANYLLFGLVSVFVANLISGVQGNKMPIAVDMLYLFAYPYAWAATIGHWIGQFFGWVAR